MNYKMKVKTGKYSFKKKEGILSKVVKLLTKPIKQ